MILSPNASTNFKPSDVSVNKISANWRQFQLACNLDIQGLQDVDNVSAEFVEWWTAKKVEVRQISADPSFRHNVRIYVAQVIWRMKVEQGCVFDADLKPIVHLASFVFANLRSQIHEAFNRAVKVHQLKAGDDAGKILDDKLQVAMLQLLKVSNLRLEHILNGAEANTMPALPSEKENAA